MGRPPLSSEQHAAKGTRPTRAVEKVSNVLAGRPKMPRLLSPEGRKAWKRAVEILESRGQLTVGDAPLLELYAETFSRWRAALAALESGGLMQTVTVLDNCGTAHEKERVNPVLKIAETAEKQLLALTSQLGLTPISREKVRPAKLREQDRPAKPGTAGAMFPELFLLTPSKTPAPEPEPEEEEEESE